MATRSWIANAEKEDNIKILYCHWDGNPDTNGETLLKHWVRPTQIQKMYEKGSMSTLGEDIESCEFYTDMGYQKDFSEHWECETQEALIDSFREDTRIEYLYIFTKKQEWLVYDQDNSKPKKLKDYFGKPEETEDQLLSNIKTSIDKGRYIEVTRKDGFKVFLDKTDEPMVKSLNETRLEEEPCEVVLAVGMVRGLQIAMNYAERYLSKEDQQKIKKEAVSIAYRFGVK